MSSSSKSYIQIILVIILLAGNVFFGGKYFLSQKEFNQEEVVLEKEKLNEDILDFTKLFIEKVLKTETEVDFETRLMLENAMRNFFQKFVIFVVFANEVKQSTMNCLSEIMDVNPPCRQAGIHVVSSLYRSGSLRKLAKTTRTNDVGHVGFASRRRTSRPSLRTK